MRRVTGIGGVFFRTKDPKALAEWYRDDSMPNPYAVPDARAGSGGEAEPSTERPLSKLTDTLNWLSDMDWGWWPVVALRPKRSEDIDSAVVLKLTPIFGSFTAMVPILTRLMSPAMALVLGWITFFVVYRLTFAIAWNARARVLRDEARRTLP